MKKIGLSIMALGLGIFVFAGLAKTAIVIEFGIRVFNFLFSTSRILIAGGMGTTCVSSIREYRAFRAKLKARQAAIQAQSKPRPVLTHTAGRYDPHSIRSELELITRNRPDISALIEKCIDQMNAMDRRQESHQALLARNQADFLLSTVKTLDDVEQWICRNLVKIINRGTISEIGDDRIFATDEKYLTDSELISRVLTENQKKLDDIVKFTADCSMLVDEKTPHPETTLAVWAATIRDSLSTTEEY